MTPSRLLIALALSGLLAFAGCESTPTSGAPQTNGGTLATGRALFVARCTGCHVLPKVADHSAAQWPGLVAQMAKRSGLKPPQQDAVLSYILAARATERR